MGVALKDVRVVSPLPSDTSPWWWTQASSSRSTFSRLIWLSGEKRSPPASPPYAGHSATGPERSGGGGSLQARIATRTRLGRSRRTNEASLRGIYRDLYT